MSTTTHNNEKSRGQQYIEQARDITRRHLEIVADESSALFVQMLSAQWLSEGIFPEHEAKAIPGELAAHLRKHYSLDQNQALFSFFLDFFSGGLSGISDGTLSFTRLEFDGLEHFEQKFAHRLPEADRHKLHELISILKKAE